MIRKTKDLVISKIKWNRKGLDIPTYTHSFRVSELLKKYWLSDDVVLAWLLHDIIEDSDTTIDDLKRLWYSERVISLVCLCSHDKNNPDKFWRRRDMIDKLIKAGDTDAWAIKLADISDNLTECHLLSPVALERFLHMKVPVFIYYWNKYFWWTEFYNHFISVYYDQIKKAVR